MNIVEASNMQKHARMLSGCLWVLFLFLGAVSVALIGWIVLEPQKFGDWVGQAAGYGVVILRPWQTITLGVIIVMPLVLWCRASWLARMIFNGLAQIDFEEAAKIARRLARCLWIIGGIGMIAHTLAVLVITWHFPEGERALSISLGTGQLSTLLAALFAGFLAQALSLGSALWRDHQEVI